MQILPVNSVYAKSQVQPSFGERDDWAGPKPFDPWVYEKMEIGEEYIRKRKEIFTRLNKDEITLSRYNFEINELKKWLNDSKKAIDEKWHKACINYEPPKPKKNFFQRLFKLK